MKISVITAVYNAKDTLSDALESILAQEYPDVELVVIDGASSDGTLDVLEEYHDHIDILISEPDQGIYDALNKGIRHATGDVIGFLHADDLYADSCVLEQVAEAFADESIDAVYGDLEYVSKFNPSRVIRYWCAGEFNPSKIRHGWMPPHPTFYVRRRVYEQYGNFDTSFRIAADYDCMLRFLTQGNIHCHYIPEVMVKMRVGGESNRSLANIIRKSREDYMALRCNGVGGAYTLLMKNIIKFPQFIQKSS